jgi:transposase
MNPMKKGLRLAGETLACKTDRIDAWVLAELARRDLIPESGCRGPRCGAIEQELRRLGAEHRYLRLLMSAPGIGWVLGYTIEGVRLPV